MLSCFEFRISSLQFRCYDSDSGRFREEKQKIYVHVRHAMNRINVQWNSHKCKVYES